MYANNCAFTIWVDQRSSTPINIAYTLRADVRIKIKYFVWLSGAYKWQHQQMSLDFILFFRPKINCMVYGTLLQWRKNEMELYSNCVVYCLWIDNEQYPFHTTVPVACKMTIKLNLRF